MSDERQTRLPTAAHREPAGPDGTPGRVLIVHSVLVGGVLTGVRRHAINAGPDDDDERWGRKTIRGNLTEPSRAFRLGIIDADDFAKFIADESIDVQIEPSDGPPRGLIMYGALSLTNMVPRLALYIEIPPARFAWLWSEMLSRPHGQLSVSLRLAALGYADEQTGERPARYFADEGLFVGHVEQADQEIQLRVDDDWGGYPVT